MKNVVDIVKSISKALMEKCYTWLRNRLLGILDILWSTGVWTKYLAEVVESNHGFQVPSTEKSTWHWTADDLDIK